MPVRAFLYDAAQEDREVELTQQIVCALNDQQLLWVDMEACEEEEIQRVVRLFGLTGDVAPALIQKSFRPQLTNYGEFFLVSLKVLSAAGKRLTSTHLHAAVGANFLLTVHSIPVSFLEKFDEAVQGDTHFGKLYAPAFLAVLLDWHVNDFFRVLERLEAEVDRLDDEAFNDSNVTDNRTLLPKLITVRRNVSRVRRILTPHREVYAALTRPDYLLFSNHEVADHFKTLHDRLEKTIDAVENVRDLLIGSFEIYSTLTAQRTNDIVRLLTVVTVALMPVSAIAGILGMNFNSQLFETGEKGLLLSILIMLGITGLTLFVARWRRWM